MRDISIDVISIGDACSRYLSGIRQNLTDILVRNRKGVFAPGEKRVAGDPSRGPSISIYHSGLLHREDAQFSQLGNGKIL